jgi:hypothetical protein
LPLGWNNEHIRESGRIVDSIETFGVELIHGIKRSHPAGDSEWVKRMYRLPELAPPITRDCVVLSFDVRNEDWAAVVE